MAADVAISVVIPTFRRTPQLRELLGSLERQICSIPFEVIVVANLPEWDLKRVVESHGPRFRFFETGRVGVELARNKGYDRARGQIIVCLDDDCYVEDRRFLQRVHQLHDEHPDIGVIGGRYALQAQPSVYELAYHCLLDHELTVQVGQDHVARWAFAGNCSFKTKFLGARLSLDGQAVLIVDDLLVEHRPKLTWVEFLKRAYVKGFNTGPRRIFATESHHWNSTATLQDNSAALGVEWTSRLDFAVRVFRFFQEFGCSCARAERSFSMKRVLTYAIRRWLPKRQQMLELIRASERALAVARDERAHRS